MKYPIWVPHVIGVGVCISAWRTSRKQGERQARRLGRVYRRVDLVREDRKGDLGTVVFSLKDGKSADVVRMRRPTR